MSREPELSAGKAPERTPFGRLINSLLATAQMSSARQIDAELDLANLDRRLLSLIGRRGKVTFTQIARLSGIQRAQISRSLAHLTATGLVHRPDVRSKAEFTEKGRAVYEEILAVAIARNVEVCGGLDAPTRDFFIRATRFMIDEAAAMLDAEIQLSGGTQEPGAERKSERRPNERNEPGIADARVHVMVLPPLTTLASYLNRTATLLAKRVGAISSFEADMLMLIGKNEPMTQLSLTRTTGASKSQIVRALTRIESIGLVNRTKVPGRRDILLDLSAEGRGLWRLLTTAEADRDARLLGVLEPGEEARYRAVLTLLMENARAMARG
ncbi:DNA-binding MarR family transcriptional regulator [Sphingobium sp. B1D7B]|uniref:MarR family winged helix-turn-helix transcriptional regulator n=1 Tax=unclassified Sphingobium TaxID=2611147 RepID=UPI002224770F|nr:MULTISPECIES: MarR family transcriptional regulator [unclassified Sphingobium]MCW2391893.1 DNA-binding MarR family transcriptional regulator [Sphingobium sp. B11D3A]MCW2403648.1 DNA-binding MarR family transcriptional regulator [Sphingobium sp. B1D7B]